VAGDALTAVLRRLLAALNSAEIPAAVMGGIGVSAWKHVRATQDIGLLVSADAGAGELLRVLSAAGFRPKREPPLLALGDLRLLQLLCEVPGTYVEVQADLLLADSEYHRTALARRVPVELEGIEEKVSVLSCEDLVLHKLLAGRILDLADASALLRANRERLEIPYLLSWAGRLDVMPDLAQTWEEAFPGEALPDVAPA
jgi:hypothetical protein